MKLNEPVDTFDMKGAPMRVTPKAEHGIHFAVIERPPGRVVAQPCFARHQLEAFIASLPQTEDMIGYSTEITPAGEQTVIPGCEGMTAKGETT
jgi:hypothetical protein